ncbi:2-hexaprenyl-6-methoxy-1,4-benzoquinone methyltransferase [Kappamyces sp. JEL0680]|nr:2-hexaprenyl-6-methoxy-1,4-benzoquinone methyltransferase [Kappamyces sp. JEL0680]
MHRLGHRGLRALFRHGFSTQSNDGTTHFGFKTIPKTEKETLVGQVFKSVAGNYDVMNDFMSAGIHRLWKDEFIKRLSPTPDMKLLDVAGGTGDIAFRFVESIQKEYGVRADGNVRLVDINPAMLQVGQERAAKRGYLGITFEEGNAEMLENVPSDSVDAYTIAFGIRNCTNIDKVIAEAYRVLKPGGRFMVLEFSHVSNPVLSKFYDLHSFHVIPALGELVAHDRNSYQYLVESIRNFPKQDDFVQLIRAAGFKTFGQGYQNLTFGVAAIHSGFKL